MGSVKVEPGIYPGVDFDTYASWDAANHSMLVHFAKTPAHAQYAALHQEEKVSTNLGHLVHQVILEPRRLKENYLVAPKVDRRTKIGKAEWAKHEAEAAGRIIVSTEDMATAKALLFNAQNHAVLREMLGGPGINEMSMVWPDPEFGVLCKGRLDRVTEYMKQGYVVDLKTHGFPATRHSFEKSIHQYGYHQQAAWYLRGLEVLMPLPEGAPERRFAWAVCETKEPNLVRVFDADDEALQMGLDETLAHLAQYKACRDAGVWPGWGDGMEIAGLPPWAMKRFEG